MQLRIILSAVTCFLFMAGNAQMLGKLQVSNPAPRIGDVMDVKVVFELPVAGDERENRFTTDMKISTPVTAPGNVWIGPFTFKINGQEYTTDSVSVFVAEKKPERDSVIVRQVVFMGDEYLVVEQFIRNKGKKQNFVELKDTKLAKGLKLDNTTTSSTTGGKIDHMIAVYRLTKEESYQGGAVITKNDLENLPANIVFPDYQVQ